MFLPNMQTVTHIPMCVLSEFVYVYLLAACRLDSRVVVGVIFSPLLEWGQPIFKICAQDTNKNLVLFVRVKHLGG